jgi:hypothetical protein
MEERSLRLEVVVDDGHRHARAASDLVDRSAAIPAFGEHVDRGVLDHGAAIRSLQSPPLQLHRLTT